MTAPAPKGVGIGDYLVPPVPSTRWVVRGTAKRDLPNLKKGSAVRVARLDGCRVKCLTYAGDGWVGLSSVRNWRVVAVQVMHGWDGSPEVMYATAGEASAVCNRLADAWSVKPAEPAPAPIAPRTLTAEEQERAYLASFGFSDDYDYPG